MEIEGRVAELEKLVVGLTTAREYYERIEKDSQESRRGMYDRLLKLEIEVAKLGTKFAIIAFLASILSSLIVGIIIKKVG